ncbi:DUF551 domain-containing protein [Vibrio sp. SCSIO 43136]|uniref:DUF551 domain-containing protein n=1 Tax=Vibrio sp. SCSIO 43136 TaxID=2819101 RepID=UPI002074D08D|nr:DUF551 domain-containing protein [Vibrio sp. SCSIO 43136]USD64191.1 DUF551 domain-containing protein [Vibrio sp. SCSIO 43136]
MDWKSVEDELPECGHYGVEVIAYLETPIKYGERIVFYTFFRGEWTSINGSTWPGKPLPTHWMYKPEPPKA